MSARIFFPSVLLFFALLCFLRCSLRFLRHTFVFPRIRILVNFLVSYFIFQVNGELLLFDISFVRVILSLIERPYCNEFVVFHVISYYDFLINVYWFNETSRSVIFLLQHSIAILNKEWNVLMFSWIQLKLMHVSLLEKNSIYNRFMEQFSALWRDINFSE